MLILCILLAISDGDTIRCRTEIGVERIRIYGLNCPELMVGRVPNWQGFQARRSLAELLDGKRIELKRRERDRYGRTVAKVFADGRDVACMPIRDRVCKRYAKYDRQNEYEACAP